MNFSFWVWPHPSPCSSYLFSLDYICTAFYKDKVNIRVLIFSSCFLQLSKKCPVVKWFFFYCRRRFMSEEKHILISTTKVPVTLSTCIRQGPQKTQNWTTTTTNTTTTTTIIYVHVEVRGEPTGSRFSLPCGWNVAQRWGACLPYSSGFNLQSS